MNRSLMHVLSIQARILSVVAAFAPPIDEVLAVVCSTGVSPCSGNANQCGIWLQIPSCGENYVNCTNGWPAHMKATHMILLRAGDGTSRVLMWHSSCGYNPQSGLCNGGAQTNYWNPTASSGVPRRLPVTQDGSEKDELFCAGHVVLDDGTVFTAGGTNVQGCPGSSENDHGSVTTWIFNPASSDSCGQIAQDNLPAPSGNGCPDTNCCGDTLWPDTDGQGHCLYVASGVDKGWRRRTSGDSQYERWYPTCTMLPSGKVLVTSGGTCGDVTADVPELYDRFRQSSAFDSIPGAASTRYQNPWYPFVFALKSNKAYHVGPHLLNNNPPASMQTLVPTVASSWQSFGTSDVRGGSAVMYTTGDPSTGGPAMILKTGGFLNTGSQGGGGTGGLVDKIEIVKDDGTHTLSTGTMAVPRLNHNLTVLPNGKVLITGGQCGVDNIKDNAVYFTELWDPTNPTAAPVRLADAPSLLMAPGRAPTTRARSCCRMGESSRLAAKPARVLFRRTAWARSIAKLETSSTRRTCTKDRAHPTASMMRWTDRNTRPVIPPLFWPPGVPFRSKRLPEPALRFRARAS